MASAETAAAWACVEKGGGGQRRQKRLAPEGKCRTPMHVAPITLTFEGKRRTSSSFLNQRDGEAAGPEYISHSCKLSKQSGRYHPAKSAFVRFTMTTATPVGSDRQNPSSSSTRPTARMVYKEDCVTAGPTKKIQGWDWQSEI